MTFRLFLTGLEVILGRLITTVDSVITRLRLIALGVQVGPRLRVRGWIDLHIDRRSRVVIGAECRIKSGFAENAVGGYRRLGVWTFPGAALTIGQGVGLSGSTIVCANSISIGDEVYIGGDCNIYDTDFHSINPEDRLARPDTKIKTAPIVIERRSFIGGHSLILKGVTIGEEAVIGAGSVVTRNVPAREIWAGNPAKFVGKVE